MLVPPARAGKIVIKIFDIASANRKRYLSAPENSFDKQVYRAGSAQAGAVTPTYKIRFHLAIDPDCKVVAKTTFTIHNKIHSFGHSNSL